MTYEIMTDPVSTEDRFTYERAAITEWLRIKDTSPKTGATLEASCHPSRSLCCRTGSARLRAARRESRLQLQPPHSRLYSVAVARACPVRCMPRRDEDTFSRSLAGVARVSADGARLS